MNDADWARCSDPMAMLAATVGKRSLRQWNLIACGFARLDWDLLVDERSRRAIEVSERHEDGRASFDELGAAYNEAMTAAFALEGKASVDVIRAAGRAARATERPAVIAPSWSVAQDRRRCDVIRDVLGAHPSRPLAVEPAWRTPEVVGLARRIRDERSFGRLPELAEALERAGCRAGDLIGHLRPGGEHWRGCWALDLLLGSEYLARHRRRSKRTKLD
jgi:hypothetical protein